MSGRLLYPFLGLGLGAIGGSLFLPVGLGRAALILSLELCASLAVVAGVRLHRPARPLPWLLFAAGLLSLTAGSAAFAWYQLARETAPPFPSLADGLLLSGYLLLAAGALLLARGLDHGRERLIDATLVTVGLAVPAWAFGVYANLSSGVALLDRLVTITYPTMDMVVLAALARLVATPMARTPSYRSLAGAVLALLSADLGYSALAGDYAVGSWIDATWLLSLVLFGVAALHPSMASLACPAGRPAPRLTAPRLLFLAAALVTAPIVLAVSAIVDVNGDETFEGIVLGASVLSAGLVLVRLKVLVNQRARIEEELRKSNERFEVGVAAVRSAIFEWDIERGTTLREGHTTLFGYLPEEVADTYDWWLERVHPDDRKRMYEATRACMAGDAGWEQEYRFRTRDGSYRDVLGRAVVVRDARGRLLRMIGGTVDISERKQAEKERARLEEELRQSQKLEAVGRLAGGIAHDFNNLLTAISGYCELLLARLDERSSIRPDIEEIAKAAQRTASITQQLLAFSRKQLLRPEVLHLNAALVEIEDMLRRLIGEDVQLALDLDPRAGRVNVDPGQLQQVVLNLAINARDAMPDGGKLMIATAGVELGEEDARKHPSLCTGSYAMLAVSDTGAGMDTETRERIFEPFFTTKQQGEGTGLGLATVYGIVEQSRGHIEVESEPGRGTTFRVYLPRVEAAAEPSWQRRAPGAPLQGSETVLLVEDEHLVRSLTGRILRERGYTALEARDGEEALELAAGFEGHIDLLLTDTVMPGMSGREVAERLRTLRPELRVLYTSGYTDDAIVRRGVLAEEMAFLQKPFTPDDLARKVREVLGDPVDAAA